MSNRRQDTYALAEKLREAFTGYQWRLDNPFPKPEETLHLQVTHYQSNPLFHAKVDTLTAGVLDIVHKWLKK